MTLVTVLLISSVITFAAADTTVRTFKGNPPNLINLTDAQREAVQQVQTSSLEGAVKSLVDSGVLTSDEGTAILKTPMVGAEVKIVRPFNNLTEDQRLAIAEETKSILADAIEQLVEDGTITKEEADLMCQGNKGEKVRLDMAAEKFDAIQQARQTSMEKAAANLVGEGVLTQEEADAMLVKPEKEMRQKGNVIFQNLTEDQRAALEEAKKANLEAALAELVDNGTITQEQADQISIAPNHGKFIMNFENGSKREKGRGNGERIKIMQNQEI